MKHYEEISGKYTEDENELLQAAHLHYPNRNTSKGKDTIKQKK